MKNNSAAHCKFEGRLCHEGVSNSSHTLCGIPLCDFTDKFHWCHNVLTVFLLNKDARGVFACGIVSGRDFTIEASIIVKCPQRSVDGRPKWNGESAHFNFLHSRLRGCCLLSNEFTQHVKSTVRRCHRTVVVR